MASIIPGFEYDIFISYRQKDNKGDRWVSEFVEALKTELESTFKDEISVYFDISPHDGLLETHDVDASLKEKLKCLIFIPILSRTYCDPRSFAWEHEFKAFIEGALQDQFGLKVKLPGGNVANRVLPVRIHDFNTFDVELFESTIGGVLRGIDFIYKSAGVNRPLRANEDHPQDNLNKTYYRDQINKVANSIEEIISSLATGQSKTGEEKTKQWEPERETGKGDKRKGLPRKAISNQKSRKWLIMMISLVMFFAGAFAVYKIVKSGNKSFDITKLEKSIAVLPFVNDSPDQENTYFINGLMEEILNNLQKIKDFRVLSRTSTEQYRGTARPTMPEIGKKLNVNFIVEGSGQKIGNKFVLRVQLIAVHNERHLWGESYTREIRETSDIIGIQSQVAQNIAAELKATITPEEKQFIEKTYTTDLTALDFYQRGDDELGKYYSDNNNIQALKRAEEMYYKALEYDSTFAMAYSGLSEVVFKRHLHKSFYSQNYLDSALMLANRALSFDDHLAIGYFYRGNYYLATGNSEQAIQDFEKAIQCDPNFSGAYSYLGYHIYITDSNYADFVKGLQYIYKAVSLEHGKDRAWTLRDKLGDAYGGFIGFPEKKKYYYDEAFKLDNDSGYLKNPKTDEEVIKSLKESYVRDSNNISNLYALAGEYSNLGQYKESLKYVKKIEKFPNVQVTPIKGFCGGIGDVYLKNGFKEESNKWFNKQVKMSEESLKLGRYLGIGANLDLAIVYAKLGNKAKVYENLKILARPRVCQYWLFGLVKEGGVFGSIRNEPEYQEILKEMETKYQAEHERVRKWLEEQGRL